MRESSDQTWELTFEKQQQCKQPLIASVALNEVSDYVT